MQQQKILWLFILEWQIERLPPKDDNLAVLGAALQAKCQCLQFR